MQRIAAVLGAIAVFVTPAAAAKPRPDLVVTTLHALPTAVAHNGQLNIHVWVRNRGRRTARPSRLGFELLGTQAGHSVAFRVATRRVGRLKARHARHVGGPFRIPGTVPPGTYQLEVCADSSNAVDERDEANNCRWHLQTVTDGSGAPAVLAGGLISITRAIQIASERGLHEVDLLPGKYRETVMLGDGIDIYGTGATLTGMVYADTGSGVPAGVTLVAQNLTKPTRVEGLAVQAPDVSRYPGRDATGVLARQLPAGTLLLSHVTVNGGAGGAGRPGHDGFAGADGGDGGKGGDAQALTGGCDSTTFGAGGSAGSFHAYAPSTAPGNGGNGGRADTDCPSNNTAPTAGADGDDAFFALAPFGLGGFGGDAGCGPPQHGTAGRNGTAGAPAPNAAAGGTVPAGGVTWVSAGGLAGGAGQDGTGGGGGGGSGACDTVTGAGGGGGGAGGAAGEPGTGGTGGGAAFAIVAAAAVVRVEASSIVGGTGGAGGDGGKGGPGGRGGISLGGGAASGGASGGGDGGHGGDGGNGADGGGGAGGPSAGAMLLQGSLLDVDAATQVTAGTPGTGGKGSAHGAPGVAVGVLRP